MPMEVRAKKALGQHFLTDQSIAMKIVDSLGRSEVRDVLEIGPGMGVLTQYLLKRDDIDLKLVELDGESVEYLLTHFPGMQGKLYQADYLRLDIHTLFQDKYRVIGNFPYNISSQIFFKILEDKDRVPEVVCMIQKEVAERIAESPAARPTAFCPCFCRPGMTLTTSFPWDPGLSALRLRSSLRSYASGAIPAVLWAATRSSSKPWSRPPSTSAVRLSATP